jgi:uncharacterized Zn finger protein
MMVIKKCPACNSSRITDQIIGDYYQISCANCGYVNRREVTKE